MPATSESGPPNKAPDGSVLGTAAGRSVLIVSPLADDHVFLTSALDSVYWRVHHAYAYREASTTLARYLIAVVICNEELHDGDWRDLLEGLQLLDPAPCLIVTSQSAEAKLWAEVLNLGGYDVLMKPFDRGEVVRVAELAWFQWKGQRAEAENPGHFKQDRSAEPEARKWKTATTSGGIA